MADLEKTIAIIFSGVDELSGPIGTIGGKLDTFSASVEAIASPLAAAADNVIKIDAALAAMAAGGLIYAFNASMKFESAVVELQKVLGDNSAVDSAVTEATRLSEVYGESATSILLSMADFKQAGYDIDEAMTLTADALDLVIAGNIDAAEASDLIIAALKGFGLEADSARQYVDILNEVSNNYATDVEQLARGMSDLSPIASQMGFSMEESAGLLVPVIEIFRSGDEAANALKTGLLKLVDDSKPVTDALAAIGVSQYDLNGELRSGKDIFIDVATAFQGLEENQKLFITSQLVGIEQSAKMVKVFDNLKLSTEIASTAMDSAGSAAKEVAQRLESAEVSVDRFKVGFENLARTVGDQFKIAAQEAIDGGTDIETALRKMVDDGTFDPIFNAINAFASNVGDLLSTVAANLPEAFEGVDFSGLLDALKGIGESIGLLFEDVDLTTPEGLRDVIQRVIDTLTLLANVTSGMIDQFKPFVQTILGLIDSFSKLDVGSQKSAGEILAMAKMVTSAGLKVAAAILIIGEHADKLAPALNLVINGITFMFDSVVITWKGLLLIFVGMIEVLLEKSLLLTNLPGLGGLRDDVEANIATFSAWRTSLEQDIEKAAFSAAKHGGKIVDTLLGVGGSADGAKEKVGEFSDKTNEIPGEKTTNVAAETDTASIDNAIGMIEDGIPKEKTTDAKLNPDKPSIEKTKEEVNKAAPFQKVTNALLNKDKPSFDKTTSAINEIPESKLMEIQLQGDIDIELAQIKAQAESVQTAFEWTAKLNIAQIEADAKVAAAAFDSVASSVDATAAAAADMFSSLLDNWEKLTFASDRNTLMGMVQQQLDMQKEALEIQRDLTEAQIEYMQAKADALSNGDGLIKIDAGNVVPHVRAFMMAMLEEIQMTVTEEAAEYLLGLGVTPES